MHTQQSPVDTSVSYRPATGDAPREVSTRTTAVPVEATPPGRTAGIVALVGIGVFVAAVVVLHFVQHDRDPMVNWVSDYALGRAGWVMTLGFVALGVASGAIGVGIGRSVQPSRARTVALVAIAAATISDFGSALFETDPPRADGSTGYTGVGALHDLSGFVGFIALIVVCFALARAFRHDEQWRSSARVARVMGWVSIAGFVATVATGEVSTPGSDGAIGLVQRLFLVIPLTAGVLLCRRLIVGPRADV